MKTNIGTIAVNVGIWVFLMDLDLNLNRITVHIVARKWEEKKMENKYILQNSIDTYGEKAIIDLFFEESAELTKALLKARRYGTDPKRISDIVDEIADVTICLEYLKMIYKCDKAVDDRIDYKIDRTAQRIAELNSRQDWKSQLYNAFTGGKC